MDLVRQIVAIYDNYEFETQVLSASLRGPMHVIDSALAGAHIAQCRSKRWICCSTIPSRIRARNLSEGLQQGFSHRASQLKRLPAYWIIPPLWLSPASRWRRGRSSVPSPSLKRSKGYGVRLFTRREAGGWRDRRCRRRADCVFLRGGGCQLHGSQDAAALESALPSDRMTLVGPVLIKFIRASGEFDRGLRTVERAAAPAGLIAILLPARWHGRRLTCRARRPRHGCVGACGRPQPISSAVRRFSRSRGGGWPWFPPYRVSVGRRPGRSAVFPPR